MSLSPEGERKEREKYEKLIMIKRNGYKLDEVEKKKLKQYEDYFKGRTDTLQLEEKEDIKGLETISADNLMNMEFEPFSWCVEDIIPETGIGILSGQPGSGKTWLSLLQACCIASGKKWFGYETKKKRVLYIDEENIKKSIQDRLKMIVSGHNFTSEELKDLHFMSNQGLNIDDDELIEKLKEKIEELEPGVIYIDMLDNIHNAKNENDAGEINKLISKLKEIVRVYDVVFVLLTHNRKESNIKRGRGGNNINMSDIRGSSVFGGRADFILIVDSTEDNLMSIYHRKSRYGAKIPGFAVLMNFIGQSVHFDITSKKLEEKRIIDKCSDEIIKLMKGLSNPKEPLKKSGIKSHLENIDYRPATIDRALEKLELFKKINKPKRGYYALIDTKGIQKTFDKVEDITG